MDTQSPQAYCWETNHKSQVSNQVSWLGKISGIGCLHMASLGIKMADSQLGFKGVVSPEKSQAWQTGASDCSALR